MRLSIAGLMAFTTILAFVLFQNCSGFSASPEKSSTRLASVAVPAAGHIVKDVCEVASTQVHCKAITSAYKTYLRRSPGVDEVTHWDSQVSAGKMSLTAVVSAISTSAEAKTVSQASTNKTLLWGPWIGGIPSERNVALENLNAFNQWVGKPASLVGFNSWWHESVTWGSFNASLRGWMNEAITNGATPVVLWLPMDPNVGLRCGDPAFLTYLRNYSAKSIAAGNRDAYIRQWAQQAKTFGKPFYLRPFHELNSRNHIKDPCEAYVTPWTADLVVNGERLNSPEDLIAAWRHVVDVFRAEGVTNVKWMWSVLSWPSANFGGNNYVSMKSIYPGDSYVDMIGIECYNFSTTDTTSCAEIMKGAYSEASALSPVRPIINVEMGIFAGPGKAKWVSEALDLNHPNSTFKQFPRLSGFMYWQDSRINGLWLRSDSGTMAAFKSLIANPAFVPGTGGGAPDTAPACRQDATSIPHAAVAYFYQTPSSNNCLAEQYIRGCNRGILEGDPSYEFSSCSDAPLDAESARKIVTRVMTAVLERTSAEMAQDAGGVAYWISRLQGGLSIDGLTAQLKGSDEYFLRRAYETYLKRKADLPGLKFFIGEISAGRMTRAQIVANMQAVCAQRLNGECGGGAAPTSTPATATPAPTAEMIRQTVVSVMSLVLERTAAEMAQDSAGIAYWVSRVQAGLTVAGLTAELKASDEYFVRQSYVTYLRRKADVPGVAYYVGEIKAGRKTRAQVAADLKYFCDNRVGGECP